MNNTRKLDIAGTKVTPLEVDEAIVKITYQKMGQKITICHLTLADSHEVIGMSGVVNANMFDKFIGQEVAYGRAVEKVWSHMGSILQDRLAN